MSLLHGQIENNFTYHKPFGTQAMRYEAIREHAKSLAHFLDEQVPDSREKSLALTKLEEAIFWANAGIARNEKPDPEFPKTNEIRAF